MLENLLSTYDLAQPLIIEPVFENSNIWQINNNYIFKKSHEEEKDIDKILEINKFLKQENIPSAEYVKTRSGDYYITDGDNIYSLTRKINGEHLNLDGGDIKTARHVGVEIARLHKALKKMGAEIAYESDLTSELEGQIEQINAANIDISPEIIKACLDFKSIYKNLPRQLIHRDIHSGNMLFANSRLVCFLDFDSSQINARIFDIAYFVQSLLFIGGNYKKSGFINKWTEFFGAFLQGYNSENKLTEHEVQAIHKMCLVMQVSFISFYLWLEEKRALVPERVSLAQWIYNNGHIFTFKL